mmetsp:Transcript_15739/g.32816  ORF Transcript_15739/g.32816 Transcript_15739/m.32816 type:complete len:483 (+) Transcript_15739:226-1674(+)
MAQMSKIRQLSITVAALFATGEAFTTQRTARARPSYSFPHHFVTCSDEIPINLDRAIKAPPIPNFSPCGPSLCSVETLDAEMDTFADPNDKRYSASDWLHNMKNFHNSSILRDIKNPVSWITAWSTLVSFVYKLLHMTGHGDLGSRMCLGSTPHSLISSSIGLLLVFRTNSAYQKFREGRKTWEKLSNTCRDITRMISVYEQNVGTARKHRIQRLLAAFPYLLHHHIQPRCLDHSQCEELRGSPHALVLHEPYTIRNTHSKPSKARECWVDKRSLPWCLLPDSVLDKCAHSHNRPLWISDRLSLEFTEITYTENFTSRERLELLKHANKLSECIGNCERIHQTAVPLNYARHALRSLTLWSFTLPFGIVDKLGLLTGPVVGVVAWLMFGVYQIGHTIEDPFQGSLRLTDMCNSIYRDVMYGDRTQAGMRRESAFRKDGERERDWESVGDAFGLGWTMQAQKNMEVYNDKLVLASTEPFGQLQ